MANNINDAKLLALATAGYSGQINEAAINFYRVITANLTAIEMDYWKSIAPSAVGNANDVKKAALAISGYTQPSIQDAEYAYWTNVVLGGASTDALLQEDGVFILQEDNFKILI